MSRVNPENQRSYSPKIESTSMITIDKIANATTTDFDLFIRISSGLEIYAVAPYQWTHEELKRLSKQGHGVLYYCTEDVKKVEAYMKVSQITRVDMGLPPEERLATITDLGAEITQVLFDYPLTTSTLQLAKGVATDLVETVMEDITCVNALGKLAHHDYYTYYHSSRVAAYALALAMQQGLYSDAQLRDIALGCLLHDIGKSKVDLDIINKQGKLSGTEWEQMQRHPVFGDGLVEQAILQAVPRSIILSHHERVDGRGYPHGLGQHELLDEVRLASFADVFDALTTNRPYQPSRTRYEAMDLIRHKLLDGLDKEAYKAMVAILKLGSKKKDNVA